MTPSTLVRRARCGLLLLVVVTPALGQALLLGAGNTAPQVVTWKTGVQPDRGVREGSRVTLTVSGTLRDGWHIYSLKQLPLGPIPLRVAIDANPVATADGAVVESTPTTIHDARFGLDTHFYSHAFVLRLPVRLASHVPAAQQLIPVSVRFQACSGEICEPPKTVHLSVPIQPAAGG